MPALWTTSQHSYHQDPRTREQESLYTREDLDAVALPSTPVGTLAATSNTFTPYAHLFGPPDCIFNSTDDILFYVHYAVLITLSSNSFNWLLTRWEHGQLVHIPEVSDVLNEILHIVYDISSEPYDATFQTLSDAVNAMPRYGLTPESFITPEKAVFAVLYAHAPHHPVELYALAAQHGVEALARSASGHLLALDLTTLSEEMVVQMGSRYMKRLFFLHIDRMSALGDILMVLPKAHPGPSTCERALLPRAWALAVASLNDVRRPSLSPQLLASSIKLYASEVVCTGCKKQFMDSVSEVAARWASVKATI